MSTRLFAVAAVVAAGSPAFAQFYPNYGYGGTSYNPFTGAITQTAATVDPFTGLPTVVSNGYNPLTGAVGRTVAQYNPLTGTTTRADQAYNPFTGAGYNFQNAYNPYLGGGFGYSPYNLAARNYYGLSAGLAGSNPYLGVRPGVGYNPAAPVRPAYVPSGAKPGLGSFPFRR